MATCPRTSSIGVGCGAGCRGMVPFADTLQAVPAGKWQVVGVPLKCFAKGGADTSKVNETLIIESEGKLDCLALGGQARHRRRQDPLM